MGKVFFFLKDIDTSQVPTKRIAAWMPKGDVPYYDKACKQRFTSRAEKRKWLVQHKISEYGETVRTGNEIRGLRGREKTRRTPQQQAIREATQRYIRQQGGVTGLLERIKREPHRYV